MVTSQNGIEFIRKMELVRLSIYNDVGHPAIGYGHDLTPAELSSNTVYGIYIGAGITMEQADSILAQDLKAFYEPAVNRLAPQANQNQFDALVDFTYNLGVGALAIMLHHGFDQAPAHMPAWCYAKIDGVEQKFPALEARREAEVELFNTPVS